MPSDRELVWTMVAIAVVDIGAAAYVSVVRPRLGFVYAMVAAYFAAVLLQCIPIVRANLHKGLYSVAGLLWLIVAVAVFVVWNFALTFASVLTRWWTVVPPLSFDITVVVGLLPLMVGIWQLVGKLRSASP